MVESVRSLPGWYCSTVWTTVSSRQRLVVEFGTARDCLSFPSFYAFSPFLSASPSPRLSSHHRKLCPERRVCYEKAVVFRVVSRSVFLFCYCYIYGRLRVHVQAAVTRRPPLPSRCTLGFVSPFTL